MFYERYELHTLMVTHIIQRNSTPTHQSTMVSISKCVINNALSNKCLNTVYPQLFLQITLLKELPQIINDEHISEESLDTEVKNHLSVDFAELQKLGTKKNQRNLKIDIMWHAVATNT